MSKRSGSRPPLRPRMLYSDDQGTIREHPLLLALGDGGGAPVPLSPGVDSSAARISSDAPGGVTPGEAASPIPMPRGSDLFMLPGRTPLGWHPHRREIVPFLRDEEGRAVHAVACFLAPAHTAALLATYETRPGAPVLPLYSYAAVGFARGRYWTAACRVDPDTR